MAVGNNNNNNKAPESFILFEIITSDGRVIQIERTSNWEINITQAAIKLEKRWRNWKRWNFKTIEIFEKLAGRKLMRETDDKRNPQTFLALVLALRVLNDYDAVLSYQIFGLYEQELLSNPSRIHTELESLYKQSQQRIEILEATVAKLSNSAIDVDLKQGKYLLYAYVCNQKVKFGTSFTNKNGERPKSHKTSVPDLCIGFVIYTSKENLQELNRAIKKRFKTKKGFNPRKEHLDCSITDLEEFVFTYSDVMDWDYIKEDIHRLKRLNIFLA